MAYKKYITKNGKIYGPYVYHSRRINGKVVSEYRGVSKEKKTKKKFIFLLGGALLLSLIIWTLFFQVQSTGRIILDVEGTFENGILNSGKINFVLNEGELIPLNSTILIENGNKTYKYSLKKLLSTQEIITGDYYLKEQKIVGSGQGYGFIGIKEEFPTITFDLKLIKKEISIGGGEIIPEKPFNKTEEPTKTLTNETIKPENETQEKLAKITNETEIILKEPTNETIESEEPIKETEKIVDESAPLIEESISEAKELLNEEENQIESETPPEEPTQEKTPEPEILPEKSISAPLTGNAITNLVSGISNFLTGWIINEPKNIEIISGEVSKQKNFTYKLQNQEATIIPGTIKLNGNNISEDNLEIILENNKATIKTNYVLSTKGFGEGYLGNPKNIQIDLSKLNLILKEGNLNVKLIFNQTEIFSFEQELSQKYLDEIQTNKTEIEKIADEIFNMTNQTINETFELVQDFNLTEEEKQILKSRINFPVVQTEINSYRNRILVLLTIGDYSIEYSYPENFSNETLQSSIEKDRYLFLKDIIDSFTKETYPKERMPEIEQDYAVI